MAESEFSSSEIDPHPLTPGQILTAAFQSDPWLRFVEPDAQRRARWLPWFMDASARVTRQAGVVDQLSDATALWFPPGANPFSAWNTVRSGLVTLPARIGRSAHRRFQAVEDDLDHVAGDPTTSWYLYMLAVHPRSQGRGLARQLLERGLARADAAGQAVRLETNRESNVHLYQRFGFELVSALDTPGLLPQWVMVRAPR